MGGRTGRQQGWDILQEGNISSGRTGDGGGGGTWIQGDTETNIDEGIIQQWKILF